MYLISDSLFLLFAGVCISRNMDVAGEHHFGIIGGTPINITVVPFMAMYRPLGENWECGATIVHSQFLVTAGHCVNKMNERVTVGTDKAEKGGTDYEIANVFRHPKYYNNGSGVDYDIAVIKLKKNLTFNNRVNILKMADSSMTLNNGEMLQAVGFGRTEKEQSSSQLLSVMLPYVDIEKCRKMYVGSWAVTDRMICAGGEEGKGEWKGDSGGPLFYKGHLYGAVSWSKGLQTKGSPSVHAYVPSMRDFIDNVIKMNS